ncbi:transcription termination factor Rho, partial [Streptomyces sp. NPDC006334]
MTTTLEHPSVRPEFPAQLAGGVLDVDGHGKGQLRAESLLPSPADLQVPAALIRRLGLRRGD